MCRFGWIHAKLNEGGRGKKCKWQGTSCTRRFTWIFVTRSLAYVAEQLPVLILRARVLGLSVVPRRLVQPGVYSCFSSAHKMNRVDFFFFLADETRNKPSMFFLIISYFFVRIFHRYNRYNRSNHISIYMCVLHISRTTNSSLSLWNLGGKHGISYLVDETEPASWHPRFRKKWKHSIC